MKRIILYFSWSKNVQILQNYDNLNNLKYELFAMTFFRKHITKVTRFKKMLFEIFLQMREMKEKNPRMIRVIWEEEEEDTGV